MDLSSDAALLRVQTATNDLVVYNLAPTSETLEFGAEIGAVDVLRAATWASFTCPYSWDQKSVFNFVQPGQENFTLTCNDRSQHLFVSGKTDGTSYYCLFSPILDFGRFRPISANVCQCLSMFLPMFAILGQYLPMFVNVFHCLPFLCQVQWLFRVCPQQHMIQLTFSERMTCQIHLSLT